MSPKDASKKENIAKVLQHLLSGYREVKPKFKVGDTVRLRKYKGIFEKGYKQNLTSELFQVTEVLRDITGLYYYHVADISGEKIEGTFYAEDLCRFVQT